MTQALNQTLLARATAKLGPQVSLVLGLLVLAILVAMPLLHLLPAEHTLHISAYSLTLVGKILCYAIVALALDLVWGYAGLLSLGLMPAQPADWDMAWRMALCGAGFALFQSPNNHTIVTSAPLHRSGAASGMLGTARLTGQTLGAVLLAAIFALRPGHDGSAESLALLLAAGWAVAAGVCSSLRVRQGPV